MEITSKQRAKLKNIAAGTPAIFQIGKNGLTDELIKQLDAAIEAREIIKINVLESAPEDKNVLAHEIADRTGSLVVQVIGQKIVLYRQNKNPKKRVVEIND
ncbi:MAG: ribosome assembly RNA-binding protein YhbY [Eubacterium sp.]|nr:ribosome assembly RNA-binding protein YhbY [Eubacterium sp.]